MCLNPRTISRPDGSTMQVGCGHCSQCLKAYQDGWTARLNEEVKQWSPILQDSRSGVVAPPVIFFTFDYNPESVPCRYLVLTSFGYYVSDERPSCPIERFWTDISEPAASWRMRRMKMLGKWYRLSKFVEGISDVPFEDFCLTDGGAHVLHPSGSWDFIPFPDVVLPWHRFSPTGLDYPWTDADCPVDAARAGVPLYALELHTVVKKPISDVFKRARRALEYKYPNVFGGDVNPRLRRFWTDSEGAKHQYPSCSLTKTFKYFYTSEYGPTTFRPHGHGICFGLTYEEFAETIAKDWESRYGHCDFSVLRPTGGAIMYLSKYCSKGNYEHPLCCKDFLYPSGKEYHSANFELSIANFGCDCALVSPTFHLCSKGLGASYAFKDEIAQYFGVQLAEYLTPSGSTRYVSFDKSGVQPYPSLSLDKIFCLLDGESLLKTVEVVPLSDGSFRIRKYSDKERKFLVGESFVSPRDVLNYATEELLLNKQYSRTYVTHNSGCKASQISCLSCWHKVGLPILGTPQVKQTRICLPRYYRQWLVSPAASALRQAASVRLHPSVDALRTFALEHPESFDQISLQIGILMDSQEDRNLAVAEKLRQSTQSLLYSHGRSPRLM